MAKYRCKHYTSNFPDTCPECGPQEMIEPPDDVDRHYWNLPEVKTRLAEAGLATDFVGGTKMPPKENEPYHGYETTSATEIHKRCCDSAAKLARIREAAGEVPWEWIITDYRQSDTGAANVLEALRREIES